MGTYMSKNKSIWFYALGLLSGISIIPVIEEFNNVIMSWIQVLMLKPSKKVIAGNKELEKYQETEEYQQTNCIGFQVSSESDYEDE